MVARFTSTDFSAKEMIGSEDGSHIFEVINYKCRTTCSKYSFRFLKFEDFIVLCVGNWHSDWDGRCARREAK